MATKQRVGRGPRPAGAPDVRTEMLQATLDCLRERGYAGTSTREIARRGGFNASLVFYYFGSLHGLLLAALDWNSERRRLRYRQVLEDAATVEDLLHAARRIYEEDVAGGHITVFSEMVSGSLSDPELREELAKRADPWIEVVQDAVERLIDGSPLKDAVPTKAVATGLVAFYMGLNLLVHLNRDPEVGKSPLDAAERFAPLLGGLFQGAPGGD